MYRFSTFTDIPLKHHSPGNKGCIYRTRPVNGLPKHFDLSSSSGDRVWILREVHLQNKVYQKSKRDGFCNWRESKIKKLLLPISKFFEKSISNLTPISIKSHCITWVRSPGIIAVKDLEHIISSVWYGHTIWAILYESFIWYENIIYYFGCHYLYS